MNKKKIITLIIIILAIVATLGISVAFLSYRKSGVKENTIKSGKITFHYQEKSRSISMIDALPMTDEQGKAQDNYFEFRITSKTDFAEIPYAITTLLTNDSTLPTDIIKIYLTEIGNDGEEKEVILKDYPDLEKKIFVGNKQEEVIHREIVAVNGDNYEKIYRLRIWIKDTTQFIVQNSNGEVTYPYEGKKLTLKVNVYTNEGNSLNIENMTTKDDTRIKMISMNGTYLLEKSSEEVDYEVTVPNEVATADFNIITNNIKANSSITELGQTLSYKDEGIIKRLGTGNIYNLLVDDNYYKVKVTSADKSKEKEYILKVKREKSKDNNLAYLGIEGYEFREDFDQDRLEYNVSLEEGSINIIGNKSSEVASIEGIGIKTLMWGENTFDVTVRAEDPNISAKVYKIKVNNVRPEYPLLEGGSENWISNNVTIGVLSPGTAISEVDYYEYYISDTNETPTEETVATDRTDNEVEISTNGIHYIYYRTVSKNGNKSTWSLPQVVKLDKDAPTITSVIPSTVWDYNNYVVFTANDTLTKVAGYNVTETNSVPKNWIPVNTIVEDETETKYQYNAAWARVFHHNSQAGYTNFSNSTEALSTNSNYKYSVLGRLNNYKTSANNWEFLLEYPEVSRTEYNRWTQTVNPTTVTENGTKAITGYLPKNISWSSSFGGLALSTSSTVTLMDGNIGSGWWYAVGAYSRHVPATPGPMKNISTTNLWSIIDESKVTTKESLTARVGDLYKNGTYYLWVKDNVGNVSSQAFSISRVDTAIPASPGVSGGSTTWSTSRTFTLTPPSSSSGIFRYEYYISNSTTVPDKLVNATGNSTSNSITINTSGQYVFFRVINNVGSIGAWSSAQNLYVDTSNYTVTYDYNYLPNDVMSTYYNMGSFSTCCTSGGTVASNGTTKDSYGTIYYQTGQNGWYFAGKDYLPLNTTYTYQFEAKASVNLTAHIGSEQGGTKAFSIGTSWQRYTHTFTVNQNTSYHAFVFYNWQVSGTNRTLYIRNLQMSARSAPYTTSTIKKVNNTLGSLPTAPTRSGYTFKGWFTDPIGGTQVSTNTKVPYNASSKTYNLYAHWTMN